MPKRTDSRRTLIVDIKKGKVNNITLHAIFKYNFDDVGREYILKHVSPKFFEVAYNNPKPKSYLELIKNPAFIEDDTTLKKELDFFIEGLQFFKGEINQYLFLNDGFEHSLLSDDVDQALNLLDKMDEVAGHSLYSLLAEYLLNDLGGDIEANHTLLKYLNANNADVKLLILMNLTRYRVDQNVSSLSYEGAIEQHRALYYEKSKSQYLDYINFKFDHLNALPFSNYAFILAFESDFSIIDRYQSLKRLLPFILQDTNLELYERQSIIAKCLEFCKGIADPYWINFRTLYANETGSLQDRSGYHDIQDDLFEGNFQDVVRKCASKLKTNSNYAELYLPFVQSLILTGEKVESFFPEKTELTELLVLMKSVLEKGANYNSDREKLLKKYYTIAHLDFSFHILEFVYNEYNLLITRPIQLIAFLNSAILRYNAFKLFEKESQLVTFLQSIPYKTELYLKSVIEDEPATEISSFLQLKVKIGYLIKTKQYLKAQAVLLKIKESSDSFSMSNFIDSWIQRNIIKTHLGLGEMGKASDVIVESFFLSGHAYAHFISPNLTAHLSDPFETRFSQHISIPIMFEIYNSPQSSIYDVIANFLVENEVRRPSELIPLREKWDSRYFNYFIEKCCVKENLEDSPFFKNVSLLEEERIKLLNFLKGESPEKIEEYNREILSISREASLRKGLLQIHESRIYVDVKGIFKVREIQLRELFDTYITLNDLNHLNVSVMKLGDLPQFPTNNVSYYFQDQISDEMMLAYDYINDYTKDSNLVQVPEIRYQYYVALFTYLKNFFVLDEDYGFKSFLSMRIRHGTFSNVLRTVFEKYHMISSKASNSNIYQDIRYWDNIVGDEDAKLALQHLFKQLSADIDQIIDTGLSWLVIRDGDDEEKQQGFFDFAYTEEELFSLFRNRVGRISVFEDMVNEVFTILFERLEHCLSDLREEISTILTTSFVSQLEELQKHVRLLNLPDDQLHSVEQFIVDCRTEIQAVIAQIVNWFRISRNRYIEEFPIELILETIRNYINSIYAGALSNDLTVEIKCSKQLKGKYFEGFGDFFINILENIVTKNKDIIEDLRIDIFIEELDGKMNIRISNNLSPSISESDILDSIESIKSKIASYQNGSDISFEKGSGYVKLCKSLAVDLERKTYSVVPALVSGRFEVTVSFTTENLFA